MQQDILYDKTQKPDIKQFSTQLSSQKMIPIQTLKKQLHQILNINKSKQQQFLLLQKQLLLLQKQQLQLQSLQLHKQLEYEQQKLQLLHFHQTKHNSNHLINNHKQQKQQGKQHQQQQLQMNQWLNKVQQFNGLPQNMIDSLLSMQYQANDDNDICLACYKNMENGEMSKYLPCCHLFHSHCIDNHLKVSKVCPACMEEVVL